MSNVQKVWLVYNAASGSNDEAALAALERAFEQSSCAITHRTCFPDDPAPTVEELDERRPDVLAVFAGDGTVNAVVTGLYGWGGPLLILPGGTMNLLSHRLHGDADAPDIIRRYCSGARETVQPVVVGTRVGPGLTGVLVGPGAAWNDVREAMRDADVVGMVSSATEAIDVSTNGSKVVCAQPGCGREDGYAAITITPRDDALACNGYFADSLADYARQAMALLQRDFRDGPHDDLGKHRELSLTCPVGEPMKMLVDGEPHEGLVTEHFTIERCEAHLIATDFAG
ncbi:MAG: diacylglycerol kinase [Novosphingobium sp.]|nr:diacylglycerol kinase [Novosphingobium sp.]